MEGFATTCGDVGIQFFVCFGDGIEETPDIATSKLPVGGLAPFTKDFGNLGPHRSI